MLGSFGRELKFIRRKYLGRLVYFIRSSVLVYVIEFLNSRDGMGFFFSGYLGIRRNVYMVRLIGSCFVLTGYAVCWERVGTKVGVD